MQFAAIARVALSNGSLPKIASIDAHDLGDRVEFAESVARIRDDQRGPAPHLDVRQEERA